MIKKGTAKFKTDNKGNAFGEIQGIAKEAINNNANTLLIKQIILFKKDNFFKRLFIFCQL